MAVGSLTDEDIRMINTLSKDDRIGERVKVIIDGSFLMFRFL